jgi:hypothetical protein
MPPAFQVVGSGDIGKRLVLVCYVNVKNGFVKPPPGRFSDPKIVKKQDIAGACRGWPASERRSAGAGRDTRPERFAEPETGDQRK